MNFLTKPRGIHATFAVDCPRCDGEFTVTNGRIDQHTCERFTGTLAELYAAVDNR